MIARFSRRQLFGVGASAAAMWTLAPRSTGLCAGQPRKRIPIALQLSSVHDVLVKDLPGGLASVAEMGYRGVESFPCGPGGWHDVKSFYYGRKAEDLRKILDRNGLTALGAHLLLPALRGDALKPTIEYHQSLGAKFISLASLEPPQRASTAALMDTAKWLTDLAEQLTETGLRLSCHTTPEDFKPMAGQIPWEVLFRHAGPKVIMQLDTCNCFKGGANPVALLKEFPHRAITIHLKEYGGPQDAVVGEGDVPWRDVFELCESSGDTEWYVVEQRCQHRPSLEAARLCLNNLHKMGR
jgi:sugar phosphate isomerase/epimerase